MTTIDLFIVYTTAMHPACSVLEFVTVALPLRFSPKLLVDSDNLQRSRKCSIVQEDEEEEDISSCSGREELAPPHCSLNRRGSRSEGRLNLALQERLADSERRKLPEDKENAHKQTKLCPIKNLVDQRPRTVHESGKYIENKWKSCSIPESSPVQTKILKKMSPNVTTTIITDSSTVSIPIISNSPLSCQIMPKYKTMPSPTRTALNASSPLQLNEIFEEGESVESTPRAARHFVSRNQNRTSYEQRRSKFHKNRTASCSSSDASDDDSENRKKRAHKLNTSGKPLPARRDSHDDSSDSQEPGTGAGTGGQSSSRITMSVISNNNNTNTQNDKPSGGNSGAGGRKHADGSMLGRRHKASRRRNGETRLRESQSLNRITEVQEDTAHSIVISTTLTATQGANVVPKVKGFGARILQGNTLYTALEMLLSKKR